MNKRAQEKYLSIWNVGVWVVLATVMVVAVALYNSAQTDSRPIEIRILHQSVSDCLVHNGELQHPLTEDFNLYGLCNIDSRIFERDRALYVGIQYTLDGELFEKEFGNSDLWFRCTIEENEDYLRGCFSQEVFVNEGVLHISVASLLNGEVVSG